MSRGRPGAERAAWAAWLWLAVFFVAPFVLVLKLSFSHTVLGIPPYAPRFDLRQGAAGLGAVARELNLDAYSRFFADRLYIDAYVSSLGYAAVATGILLLLGYPMALAMARAPRGAQPFLVAAVIAPFWTSFLLRIYAWTAILKPEGWLNMALGALGLPEANLLNTDTAIYLGLTYAYLPFMVLPLYAVLERQDPTLLEAAADLGAGAWARFWSVTFPLSLPGVAAGALLCLIPMTGEFIVPDLLGGSGTLMIGKVIWTEFFQNRDWPVAAAAACALTVTLVAPIVLYQRLQARGLGR